MLKNILIEDTIYLFNNNNNNNSLSNKSSCDQKWEQHFKQPHKQPDDLFFRLSKQAISVSIIS
jgi:hypothetical protein